MLDAIGFIGAMVAGVSWATAIKEIADWRRCMWWFLFGALVLLLVYGSVFMAGGGRSGPNVRLWQ